MKLFGDDLQDEFATWPLGLLGAAGGAVGEIEALAASVTNPDDATFTTLWSDAANRHIEAADGAEKGGHGATARGHLLRAASYLGVAIHMLYGGPVDPRLVEAFDLQEQAFDRAMALGPHPAETAHIPFDHTSMPGYFIPAGDGDTSRRPLIICTNGYDALMVDMYLGMASDATRRGYHCLLFDGPGQGAMLVREGRPIIPDWERVITAVIDHVLKRPDVDETRIVLWGWSLGGYLALRAAAGEHRLAACIADPPSLDSGAGVPLMAGAVGMTPEAVTALPKISDTDAQRLMSFIAANRGLNWKIVKRGFWVNGTPDLAGYLASMVTFTAADMASQITCPVIGTKAENDMLARGVEADLAKLTAPSTLLKFSAAEGAGDHCELMNRWLANQRILDALDEVLADR